LNNIVKGMKIINLTIKKNKHWTLSSMKRKLKIKEPIIKFRFAEEFLIELKEFKYGYY